MLELSKDKHLYRKLFIKHNFLEVENFTNFHLLKINYTNKFNYKVFNISYYFAFYKSEYELVYKSVGIDNINNLLTLNDELKIKCHETKSQSSY